MCTKRCYLRFNYCHPSQDGSLALRKIRFVIKAAVLEHVVPKAGTGRECRQTQRSHDKDVHS
jgi:hypothetical protein